MKPSLTNLHYSPELQECVEGHYIAVVEDDEYKVAQLAQDDKEIEYIVDLGSNVGMASLQFQTYFPEAKILVCEPEPECMKYTKLNTNNKLRNDIGTDNSAQATTQVPRLRRQIKNARFDIVDNKIAQFQSTNRTGICHNRTRQSLHSGQAFFEQIILSSNAAVDDSIAGTSIKKEV